MHILLKSLFFAAILACALPVVALAGPDDYQSQVPESGAYPGGIIPPISQPIVVPAKPLLGEYNFFGQHVQLTQQQVSIASLALVSLYGVCIILALIFLALALFRTNRAVQRDMAFVFGWNTFKKNKGLLVVTTLIYFFLTNIHLILKYVFLSGFNIKGELTFSLLNSQTANPYSLTVFFVWFFSGILVNAWMIKFMLDFSSHQGGRFFISPPPPKKIFNFVCGYLLYFFMVMLGTLLFVFPGIYIAMRYYFFSYVLLDQNKSFLSAFQKSALMTRGIKWELFLFWFLTQALSFLGLLILGVGALVTFPLTHLAIVFTYRTLYPSEGKS